MSRHILSLPDAHLTPFDLDAFVAHAEALNQHNRNTFTTPFPKDPSRWLSHYAFTPHPIAFTSQGDVDGGLSWLVGSTLDFSFTRALCAPRYGARGGRCFDPASLILLEVGDFCPTPRKGIFQGSSSQTCRTETRASVSTISVILIVSGALRNS